MIAGGAESMSLMPMVGSQVRAESVDGGQHSGDLHGHGADRGRGVPEVQREPRGSGRVLVSQPSERAEGAGGGQFDDEIVPLEIEMTALSKRRSRQPGNRRSRKTRGRARIRRRRRWRNCGRCFTRNGTVTAGNSSQTSDGAAAAIVMSERKARELGLKPMARFVSFARGRSAAGDHGHRSGGGDSEGAGARGVEARTISSWWS